MARYFVLLAKTQLNYFYLKTSHFAYGNVLFCLLIADVTTFYSFSLAYSSLKLLK